VNLSHLYDEEPPRSGVPASVEAPPVSAPVPASAPAPVRGAGAATAALTVPRASNEPLAIPDGLAAQRSRVKLIAAGITLALAVVIALWAVLGDSGATSPDGDSVPTKRAF
jgi:hypothetical protein